MTSRLLAGRRVLITRAEEDATRWALRLARLGATPVVFPCIMCEFLDDVETAAALRAAVAKSGWLVLTSARGAEAVARSLGGSLPGKIQVAAVGPATARAAEDYLAEPHLVSSAGTSLGLGRALAGRIIGEPGIPERGAVVAGVVVAGAAEGRDEVERTLSANGIAVIRVNVYRTVPLPAIGERDRRTLVDVDDVLLASPSAVTGLLNRAIVRPHARVITIGPTTSLAAQAAGLRVAAEARTPTLEGMLEAMA